MIIQSEKRLAELDGFDDANKPKNFQIKQNARAFEILSSNIYSDKITAVLRELGCNAYDAHVAAKKGDVPFEVHLPNSFEPWFSVKDFGIGLSHDGVMNLYTTYFDSTKTSDNDMIGGLGLGSKSPFAYTDQFTVVSNFGGKKRTYSAFVNEEGSPSIMLLTEEDTTEVNGLTIQLPAQSKDYSEFATKAKRVFHRFPTLPVITGAKVDLTKVEYVLETPTYKIRKPQTDYHGDHKGAYAVQGTVAYPIESASLEDIDYNMTQFLKHCDIDIIFPIGSVNITASREKLNYDRFTRENIKVALEAVLADVPKEFEKMLKDATTLWQVKTLFQSLETISSTLFQMVKQNIMWNGKPVTNSNLKVEFFDLVDAKDEKGNLVQVDIKDAAGNVTGKKTLQVKDHWGKMAIYNEYALRETRASAPELVVERSFPCKVDAAHIFVLVDSKIGNRTNFIKHNFKYNNHAWGAPSKTITVFEIEDLDKRLPEMLKIMGDIPVELFTRTSTLEMPPKAIAANKPRVKKVYKVDGSYQYGGMSLVEVNHDMAKGGHYLTVFNKMPVHPNKVDDSANQQICYEVTTIMNEMKQVDILKDAAGANITDIYAFNHHIRKSVKEDEVWVDMHDTMRNYWKDTLVTKNKKFIKSVMIAAYMKKCPWLDHMCRYWLTRGQLDTEFGQRSPFKKVMVYYNEHLNNAASFLGIVLKDAESLTSLLDRSFIYVQCMNRVAEVFDIKNVLERQEVVKETADQNAILHKHYPILWKMFVGGEGYNANAFKWTECGGFVKLCDSKPLLSQAIKSK